MPRLITLALVALAAFGSRDYLAPGAPQIAATGSAQIPSAILHPTDRTTPFFERMTPVQKEHSRLYDAYRSGSRLLDQGVSYRFSAPMMVGRPGEAPPSFEQRISELACASDAVVDGLVLEAISNPIADGTFLFTDYQLRVNAVIGSRPALPPQPGKTVTLTRPGGVIDLPSGSVSATIEGVPRLDVGTRYVLFMRRVPATGAFTNDSIESTFAVLDPETLIRADLFQPDGTGRGTRRPVVPMATVVGLVRGASCR